MNSSERHGLMRLLDPIRRRIALMLRRAIIEEVNDKNPVQAVKLGIFKGECRKGVERIQEYGFSSVPLPKCRAIAASVDGECAHELVIATDDREYRPRQKDPGDVMLYTYANRKDNADTEHHIYLQPETRTTTARTKVFVIDADETIEFRTKDGKNFIRIGAGYGIRMTVDGGFDNGGSDIRMKGGKIWQYAAEKLITRTPMDRKEEPPARSSETGEPTMPE